MLVHGGRRGWVRVVGIVGAVGVLGSMGTACGSRTSMLDADAYDSSSDGVAVAGRGNVSGNGTAGKTSNGTGLLGRAGSGSMPPTGSPVKGSIDATLALAPCQQYCPGYGTQCNKRLEGQECLSTCQGELNGFGPFCQALGIEALRCLTPFFSAQGGDCNAAVNRALAQCGTIVAAFDSCKKNPAAPAKSRAAFAGCQRSGGADSLSCTESFSCNDGSYITFCSLPTGAMFFDCTCVNATGQLTLGHLPPAGDLCLDATGLCQ